MRWDKLLHVGRDQVLVVPITRMVREVSLHDAKCEGFARLVRCNGPACILCRIGRELRRHVLWPVFDPASAAVRLLSMPATSRPGDLWPLVRRQLARDCVSQVFVLTRPDMYCYKIETRPRSPGAVIPPEVTAFVQQYEAGEIDITSVYPQIANATLENLPEIAAYQQILEGRV